MYLRHLALSNFRNFSSQSFEFGKKFNILVGANAQGKTNIVEAIQLLATSGSFRTANFRDMIRWGEETARIDAAVVRNEGGDEWRVLLTSEKKRVQKNGRGISSRTKRGFSAVLFSPEEILLLRDSPIARRRYIDQVIARFIPAHAALIRNYERVVSNRNALFKDENLSASEKRRRLADWNHQLVLFGTKIALARRAWIQPFNQEIAVQYRVLSPQNDDAAFIYLPFYGTEGLGDARDIERVFVELLERRFSDECARRVSLVGPHRDDFQASLGGRALQRFGSQGEHRSFILAMKIAELEFHDRIEGILPVFLLDDVASELDEERKRYFFHYLDQARGQVFVTTADAESVRLSSWESSVRYRVVEGATINE